MDQPLAPDFRFFCLPLRLPRLVAEVRQILESKKVTSLIILIGLKHKSAFGIFLKALRDTASITFEGDNAIVALSGNNRKNVA